MTRCNICGSQTSSKIITKEPRYFHGEGNVCSDCFEHLVSDDFPYLDEKALEKLRKVLQ